MARKFDYNRLTEEIFRRQKISEQSEPPCPITYIIDREKRTVVAYMEHCEYDVIFSISNILNIPIHYSDEIGFLRLNNYMINDTYRGKAKCAPEDEWNVEEGMRIARNRLLEKYWSPRHRATDKFKADLLNLIRRTGHLEVYSFKKHNLALQNAL